MFRAELNKMAPTVGANKAGPVVQITQANYPRLPPYYIDPLNEYGFPIFAEGFDDITNEQLNVFGAIVDPFSPVHAYSGILPVKELVLPNWTWQSALDNISAFFHAGPILVTDDVPDFVESRRLEQGNLPPKLVPKEKGEIGVKLPGGTLGQWTWLQPYMDPGTGKSGGGGGEGGGPEPGPLEKFMPLAVDPVDETSRLQRGPYTALEGYLQMASGAAK